MTLRLRLLLVLVGIVAAGLLVTDIAIYNSLGSYLEGRVDQQLDTAANPVANALVECALGQAGPLSGGSCDQFVHIPRAASVTPGTFGELRDTSGAVVGQSAFFVSSGGSAPRLPASLPGSGTATSTSAQYFTTGSLTGTPSRYRVLAEALSPGGPVLPDGGTLVVAIPLTEIDQTLARLVWIEGLVTAAMLVTLGTLAWWIVRRGLRPLEDMAATAGAIAAGDLSQRVPEVVGRSEVSQLGEALNVMLGNIEQAFEARAASEERLRRFLADASHELRTPLTSIRGYAEMFDRGARDRPEDLATSMRQIQAEADRMSELVSDLLLLARLDRERPIEREPVDLAVVAEEAVAALRVSVQDRQVTLTSEGPAIVTGDDGRLRQVVDNLLTNAARHTPAGTPVDVRVRADAAYVVLEVTDRGQGIAPAEQAHIFEPFHRADPSRARTTGGVGLGLAIVAAIVRAHGGAVGVDSDGASGSTFWVRLPVAVGAGTVTPSVPQATPHAVELQDVPVPQAVGADEEPAPNSNGTGVGEPEGATPNRTPGASSESADLTTS